MPELTVGEDIQKFLANEQDLEFEEEISRNPYRLKPWWRYLEAKKAASRRNRNVLHERAIKFLPSSYKLWHQYLNERRAAVKGKCITDKACQIVCNAYERALVHLHKMPVLWAEYAQFLMELRRGTQARRTFDRALQSLPITQHTKIWPLYLQWAKELGVQETAIRVYRRYLMYEPANREGYVDYLESVGQWEEAAKQLAVCVNDDAFVSAAGHTKHQLWMRLCDLCAKHPEEVTGALKVEAIIRSGLARFTDEVGRLWCKLADYYIRLGQFEKARDVYEEAINSVVTVRDFSVAFDAYSQFEESVLTAKMRILEADAMEQGERPEAREEEDDLDEEGDDTELRVARLEHLLERRPVLVSSVLLRQNPHNVHEWQKRVKLFKDDPNATSKCYVEAVKTVDPKLAVGKLHRIWLDFAKFFEDLGDLQNARDVFKRATAPAYKNVDDLASVYCAWAEMELRHDCYDEALKVMQQATVEPQEAVSRRRLLAGRSKEEKKALSADAPVQERVHRSTKVWSLYLDLEESLGTVATVKAAYDRMLEIKTATPQMVLNYAAYLEEHKYFEDSFRVYEKGVSLFGFPHVKPLWMQYLDKFVERFKGTKLERARDLFEQAIERAPPKDAPEFYIRYAKLEEEHGLVRHATAVYERACAAVEEKERLDMYRLYVSKVEQYFGVIQTRRIYEDAIQKLPEDAARDICLEYARVEQKLGEIDRARAVLQHGSQFADPRRHGAYWKNWNEFEVAHGNEETFREMLRVKRSVQMAFSQVNYMAAEMMSGDMPVTSDAEALARQAAKDDAEARPSGGGGTKRKADEGGAVETDMEALERQADKIRAAKAGHDNVEEIDLEDVDAEEEPEKDEQIAAAAVRIREKEVPQAVFGSAIAALGEQSDGKGLGALERLKGKGS